jgi:hypothetical protein
MWQNILTAIAARCYQDFLDLGLLLTSNLLNQLFIVGGKVENVTSNVLRFPSPLGEPLTEYLYHK